jgi:exonuclease III
MDVDNRLSQARAAWARLFRNSSKIQHNTNECQTQQTTQGTIVLSQENLKENTFWGDELKAKAPTNTRIYIQNVNGIILQKDGGQFTELCNIVKETQADILCIQEHNLDTTQYIVQNTLHTTSRRHWERSRLTIASSPIQFQNTWKPGGTSILSVGSITGRIKTHGSDPWGRWCYQIFQGSGGRRITIVSAYQVVANHSHNKGQYTAAAQQQSLLLRQSDKLQDPRQAFRRDITEFLHTQIQAGHLILLVGDFNERLGDDISGISKIAAQFEFVDIMSHHHQHLNDPATYARGRKRLDYILASPQLASAVQKCGYEPFNFRFHTDHRAYYVDLDTETLFRSSTQKLAAYPTRILHFEIRQTSD